MEKRFISNFAGARLVDCTPLIPRESSVSKETGRQGAAKRYRCDSRNSKVVRVHMGYILPTVSIDRFTEELSNYRRGVRENKGAILDIGDGIAYYFLPRFLFFRAWWEGNEGWGNEKDGYRRAYPCAWFDRGR